MARINPRSITVKARRRLGRNARYTRMSIRMATEIFNNAKRELLSEFDSHPVTREIERGPLAQSNFLERGNLFSFIGFEEGSDPIGDLRNFLERSIRIRNLGVGQGDERRFRISIPSRPDFVENFPFPEFWDSGSWVLKITEGMSGISHFLAIHERGRSGGGIQSQGTLGSNGFSGTEYLANMLENFKSNVRQIR